jgi:hypothetical protein
MRIGIWSAAIALAGFGIWHFTHARAPSAAEVEPLLRSYLESKQDCAGTLTVKQLDSVAVGAYMKDMGGWPIYANHKEECHVEQSGSYHLTSTTTYDGSDDAASQVAAAFARRTATGGIELYVPGIFEAGQRQMQEALQKAADSVKVN